MMIYANDYEDELPKAGGKSSVWATGPLPNNGWQAPTRQQAYGLAANGSGGTVTITSSFYLLVKYAEVTPKSFLCKGDSGASEFKLANYNAPAGAELIDLWDFGPEPWVHCSYSYHFPYDVFALTTSSDPGMAVAADPNPYQTCGARVGRPDPVPTNYSPTCTTEIAQLGNAQTHQDEGQNVLFLDSHVEFAKRATAGINDDNIYTYWNGTSPYTGACPPYGGQPFPTNDARRRNDNILVNDGASSCGAGGGPGPGPGPRGPR
jgi:hypothetical protein